MSSSPTSLARLTSLSTQTLSLLLERQRLSAISISSSSSEPSPQIKKNLRSLHTGILALEQNEGKSEASKALRDQYERMRNMLGDAGTTIESLHEEEPEPSETPSPNQPYVPYRDDPVPSPGFTPGPDPTYSDGEVFQMQQQMMDEQDTQLDHLSQSIGRQRDISLQINSELDVHTGLLEELDHDLDRTERGLGSARKQLDRFSKGVKGNASTLMIGLLIAALLILIVVFKT